MVLVKNVISKMGLEPVTFCTQGRNRLVSIRGEFGNLAPTLSIIIGQI